MNMKTWLPLCLAIVLGLAAAMFARNMMAKNKGNDGGSGKLTQIVIAKRAIGAGENLTAENCQIGTVGSDSIPDSSFRSVADLNDRVAQFEIVKGQAVTDNVLAPAGTGSGLQAIIPAGMRAISIEVNEFSGVGGMLLPGCHVDMLATLPGEQGGEMISRTVVQNVQISAVGQRMVSQPEKKGDEPVVFRSVTLLVTPVEAEAIELAANSGRPRLVLRSTADKVLTTTPGVTSSNLRGGSARKADPAYASIKAIRGTVETEVRLDSGWTVGKSAVTAVDTKAVSNTDTAPAAGGSH